MRAVESFLLITKTEQAQTHTFDKKPFKCDFKNCNKAFSVKGSLSYHKLRHKADGLFICDINDCNKAFPHEVSLKIHQESIHDHKRWHCDWKGCNKTFST